MGAQQIDQQAPLKQNPQSVIKALQMEAGKNKVFNNMCHVFALRERARSQVTIAALRLTMAREHFHHPKEEYQKALQFLANLGIGRIEKDATGQIVALKDITITLQSIGACAMSQADKLTDFAQDRVYTKLPTEGYHATVNEAPAPQAEPKFKVSLMTMFAGRPMTFDTPLELSANELATLLGEMFSKAHAKEAKNA